MPGTKTIAPLLPGDLSLLAHCRRVAALSQLVAHHLFLPTEEKHLLYTACLLHHYDSGLFTRPAVERLLADLYEGQAVIPPAPEVFPADVRAVLQARHRPGSGTPPQRRLAEILGVADAFDQEWEARPLEFTDVDAILERLRRAAADGLLRKEIVAALEECTKSAPLGDPSSWKVPVFPGAALLMLKLLQDPDASVLQVVEAAGKDPSVAGRVMQLANSALFGARNPASTLSQAIMRLGFATAQKVVTSFATRPLLVLPKLEALWPHSLEVADLAEQLACQAGGIDPAEAYLAGLLHDVGRIALMGTPLYDSARIEGLERGGCPEVYAESLILRTDHAVLGAKLSEKWRLPTTMVSAIRQHHHPETATSRLAHLLYTAEYLTGLEEDLPSAVRLDCALRGIGLTGSDIADCTVSALGSWLAAA